MARHFSAALSPVTGAARLRNLFESISLSSALSLTKSKPTCLWNTRPSTTTAVAGPKHCGSGRGMPVPSSALIPAAPASPEYKARLKAVAEAAVKAVRYPPHGLRGVAGATRASGFSQIKDYTARANDEICLLVQVETIEAMGRLEEIASVEGVNGVFIGPADLAASMGFPGQPTHPEVRAQIDDAIDRLKKIGVPSGILTMDRAHAQHCIARGTTFTAVGLDLSMMLAAAKDLAGTFGRG